MPRADPAAARRRTRLRRTPIPAETCTALLVATIVGFGLSWFGRAAWGGHFLVDHSPGRDIYHLCTLYVRWAHHVAGGHLPLWFPEFAAGYPVASAWMYGLLYPGHLLFVALPPQAAWTWSAILHMALGGLGMHLLVKEETGSPLAGVTSGLAFALSGFMVGRVLCGHLNLVVPLAWAPWAFLAATRIVGGSRRAVAWGALCLGVGALSGHVQVWFYVAPALLAFGCHRWYRAGARRTAGIGLLVAGAVAVLISAVQWLPALDLVSVAERAAADSVGLADFCAPVHHLAANVLPGVLGQRPDTYWAPDPAEHEFGAIGGLVLIVLLLPVFARAARGSRFWVAVGALGLLLAPGVLNPLSAFLSALPPFSSGRTPARALILVVLAVSVLVGHGVARWERAEGGPRLSVAAAIVGGVGALALVVVRLGLPDTPWPTGVVVRAAVAGAATAGAALAALAVRRRHPRALAALPALVVVSAALGGAPPAQTVDAAFFHTDWRALLPPTVASHRVHLLGHGFPNVERQGLRSLRELCYLDAPWYERFRADAVPERAAWLDVGAELAGIPAERLFASDLGPDDVVGRTYATHPAARLFSGATAGVPDARALAELDRGVQTLHLAGRGGADGPPDAAPADASAVHRAPGDDPGTQDYEVVAPAAGWLFVSEKYFPGWEAQVDGEPEPIRRANVMFRAVRVPAGRSHVRMTYRPATFRWGAWLSLAGLLATVALLAGLRIRRPGRRAGGVASHGDHQDAESTKVAE